MAGGVWIPKALRESPEAMARINAGDRSELDAFNAKSLFRSYHLPSFYSPVGWLAWSKIMLLWEQAEGVAHKMKAVVNTIFGDT
nr:terminase gpA endonuclease subunit [Methylorubrum zatmanii]